MRYWVILVGCDDAVPVAITANETYAKEVERDTEAWVKEVNSDTFSLGPFLMTIYELHPERYGCNLLVSSTHETREEALRAAWESKLLTPRELEDLTKSGVVNRKGEGFRILMRCRISREILDQD